jgi:hypothetical protein
MGTFFVNLFAANDQQICTVRFIGVAGIVGLIAGSGWSVFHSNAFDPIAFGGGVAAIAGAVGFGAGYKDRRMSQ